MARRPPVPRGRGFAGWDETKQRAVATLGGQAVQEKRTGHRWTVAEARANARKGGLARHGKREGQ